MLTGIVGPGLPVEGHQSMPESGSSQGVAWDLVLAAGMDEFHAVSETMGGSLVESWADCGADPSQQGAREDRLQTCGAEILRRLQLDAIDAGSPVTSWYGYSVLGLP